MVEFDRIMCKFQFQRLVFIFESLKKGLEYRKRGVWHGTML